jgi:hypothetical protein
MDLSDWEVGYSTPTSLGINNNICYWTVLIALSGCLFYIPTSDYIIWEFVSYCLSFEIVKRVLHTCLACRMMKSPRGQQIEAPLTADRVQPSRPFAITEIDFAGLCALRWGAKCAKDTFPSSHVLPPGRCTWNFVQT